MQAILITAYKNYTHLDDLVNFFDENFSIYIHIDRKSSISQEQISTLREKKNVELVSQEYNINWGGINHLKAILLLVQKAIENNNNKYFHLITGHDYPIKSLSEFSTFYTSCKDKDFMEFHSLPYQDWPEGGLDRLSRYNMYDCIDGRKGFGELFIKRFSKIQKVLGIKRRFYKGFPKLYGGSTYWSLRRESLEYVFNYMKSEPRYLKRFKYSFCSEEIFFQTILLNSPFRDKINNNNMRFIVWEERNGNFPANLDDSDYDNILGTSALFARKFEYPVSAGLLSKVKERLKSRK
ncbi:beta-1,6-N-acetylglucosaminyltransferase [Dysgonomonas sp. OttesenSCG-928-M03]|nr:beta-1,6-N-acetylglucosaminyltransferase [Dysgonomonas sp. OttesenSCG-928-M03]